MSGCGLVHVLEVPALVYVCAGGSQALQPSPGDIIRQSFYAAPLQKDDASGALEFLSGLLVVEYFWTG